ncbi:MAG: hypothetical protein HDS71_00690 [Bacteroidales bacterium]|nr:hypothetical protein [Bacteroidales bacterium]MBD5222563.1 hypothetical protein [Bacteroidales bacterium]MBD5347759.1 hypothetical protein [Bacteroides sp.]
MSTIKQTEDKDNVIDGYDRFSSHQYLSPTRGVLPLVIYPNEEQTGQLTDAHCSILRSLGFNSVVTKGTEEELLENISILINNGLMPIPTHDIFNPSNKKLIAGLTDKLSELVAKLDRKEKLGGIFTGYCGSLEDLDVLKAIVSAIDTGLGCTKLPSIKDVTSVTNQRTLQIHLIPEQSSRLIFSIPDLSIKDAESKFFAAKTQTCAGPGVWLSDSKATTKDSANVEKTRLKEFFNNLEILTVMSNYTSRPIWGKVNEGSYASMLLESMNALAYGAQGLFFTQSSNNGSKVSSVPSTANPWYKLINRIKQFEGIFLNGKTIDVRHLLDSSVSSDCYFAEFKNTMGPLIRISPVKASPIKATTDSNLTISHISLMPMNSMLNNDIFNDETLDFLVIVNNSITATRAYRLELNPYYQVYEVQSAKITNPADRSKNTLEEELVVTTNGVIERRIAPGDVLILRWK